MRKKKDLGWGSVHLYHRQKGRKSTYTYNDVWCMPMWRWTWDVEETRVKGTPNHTSLFAIDNAHYNKAPFLPFLSHGITPYPSNSIAYSSRNIMGGGSALFVPPHVTFSEHWDRQDYTL